MNEILVVEDEPQLRAILIRLLEAAGYAASGVGTGADALRAALDHNYEVILLDLNLPDISGTQVLQVLMRAKPDSRVLVLTSVTDVGPRVQALEGGAADFMLKPFVNSELLARIRLRARSNDQVRGQIQRLTIAEDIFLDPERRELQVRSERVPLSQREFTLLMHLFNRRGAICSRQELLTDVWGLGFDPGTNVVDVYVRRLRNKISADAIETVRNVGYRLIAS
ncbi:MAG TPA: response regulator transcription factor [Jatrophihabitans sp.]|jgi:DNA-binding response OmpR family regulator|nr:response regulator transcription factor [Jatrophihabitans sp.]